MNDLNEIIRGCVSGRNNAQKLLYDMFSPKLFSLCLRYSRDRSEAEDTLQEGFIRIFSHIRDFRFEGSFEGWMRRIMVNTALEKHRKLNYMYSLTEDETIADTGSSFSVEQTAAADLLKMVQELSPQYRMVFNLYAIEGYNHKEIGVMLGISEGTSKSNLSRARQVLQEKVRDAYGIPGAQYNNYH